MLLLAVLTAFVATALFLPVLISAGDLEPGDPPGPTMHTLEEIYRRIEQILYGPGVTRVEKSWQTVSYATGDDGDLEKGVTWPNPRFTDNSDGTVTDNLTGLIWLKDADCKGTHYPDPTVGGLVDYQGALDFIDGINIGTYPNCDAGYGEWRLPNVKELHSLTHYGFTQPALPNTAGTSRWAPGDPFLNIIFSWYWSSTELAGNPNWAYEVSATYGHVRANEKTYFELGSVWPVRGPQ